MQIIETYNGAFLSMVLRIFEQRFNSPVIIVKSNGVC